MKTTTTCPECGRVFDLLDGVDAIEFYFGHDCEVISINTTNPLPIGEQQ